MKSICIKTIIQNMFILSKYKKCVDEQILMASIYLEL